MKFGKIKVGDTVYIKEKVNLDINDEPLFFYMAAQVKKTTRKNFTAAGKRYHKKDGRLIGHTKKINYWYKNIPWKTSVSALLPEEVESEAVQKLRKLTHKLQDIKETLEHLWNSGITTAGAVQELRKIAEKLRYIRETQITEI